jgi:hypothetical protein
MEKIFLEFLNIYFWVFICLLCFEILAKAIIKTVRPEYEFKPENSNFLIRIITLTLFIMSITLT